jgi:hypothetical protein
VIVASKRATERRQKKEKEKADKNEEQAIRNVG